jgi:sugar lactone lactonase YvrE
MVLGFVPPSTLLAVNNEKSVSAVDTVTRKVSRGGTAVLADSAGKVHIAGSQLYLYSRDGQQTGMVEFPERPTSLCFGGSDRRILYIGARGSLYSIRLAASGR